MDLMYIYLHITTCIILYFVNVIKLPPQVLDSLEIKQYYGISIEEY